MASSKATARPNVSGCPPKVATKEWVGNSFGSVINYATGSVETMLDKENVNRFGNNARCSSYSSAASNLNVNVNVRQMKADANKKVQTLKTTIDTLSQKFRRSTRRRYRLGEASAFGARTPIKENSPVKMYSPFGIDTPSRPATRARTPAGRHATSRRICNFASPSQSFHKDVEAVSKGTRLLSSMAQGIAIRSSVRK